MGLFFGVLAAAGLLRMMRRRQLALIGLLKEYVDRQVQWSRRRAKAEAIAAAEDAKKAAKASKSMPIEVPHDQVPVG
ncbi:MAG: hypothetical protein IT423_00545 [Pirellulaceae bacterium]|nr:hypothetical protein [Pirellulaceae bacterium]